MYKIWRLLRHPEADAVSEGRAALMRGILPAGTALPPPSPDSPEIMYQLTRRDLRTDPWVRRDASAVLQRVLLRGRLPPAERALVLDRLALFESLKGDDASKELMDAWSAEAVTLANGPYTLVTCGGVLIALGRPAEAEALLTAVLASATAMGRGTSARPISGTRWRCSASPMHRQHGKRARMPYAGARKLSNERVL